MAIVNVQTFEGACLHDDLRSSPANAIVGRLALSSCVDQANFQRLGGSSSCTEKLQIAAKPLAKVFIRCRELIRAKTFGNRTDVPLRLRFDKCCSRSSLKIEDVLGSGAVWLGGGIPSRVVSSALWRMKKALRDWWRSKGLSGGEVCRAGAGRNRALECLPSDQGLIRNDLPQSSLLPDRRASLDGRLA